MPLEYRESELVPFAIDRAASKVWRMEGDQLIEVSDAMISTLDMRGRAISSGRARSLAIMGAPAPKKE